MHFDTLTLRNDWWTQQAYDNAVWAVDIDDGLAELKAGRCMIRCETNES